LGEGCKGRGGAKRADYSVTDKLGRDQEKKIHTFGRSISPGGGWLREKERGLLLRMDFEGKKKTALALLSF